MCNILYINIMYNRWEIVGTIYKLLVIYVFNVFYYCMLGSYSVYFPCLTLFVLQPAYFLLFFCEHVL